MENEVLGSNPSSAKNFILGVLGAALSAIVVSAGGVAVNNLLDTVRLQERMTAAEKQISDLKDSGKQNDQEVNSRLTKAEAEINVIENNHLRRRLNNE